MDKVLFFSPHSYIWLHAFPEALIAEALISEGLNVHYVTCGGILESYCIVTESIGINSSISNIEKSKICNKCINKSSLLLNHFNFENSKLSEYLEKNESQIIEHIIKNIQPNLINEFNIEGVPIGRASLYDFTLSRKKVFNGVFSDVEWINFLKHFESCLKSYYAGKNLLFKYKPKVIIFYSSEYSTNLVVRMQAEKLGIPCFSIFAGSNWSNRLQKMYISKSGAFNGFKEKLKLWDLKYRDLPVTIESLESILLHQKEILKNNNIMIYGAGSNKFSPHDLRKRWGISEKTKLIFLATSSYDEVSAAQTIGALPNNPAMAFVSQIEWIKSVIDYVADRRDLSLVIRIHPREFPNKRETISSAHSIELKSLLSELPSNVYVNWPWDDISFYDWIELIDVGLTSWSSVGRDLAMWGIPCINYSREFCFYPNYDLGYVGESTEEYFRYIEIALEKGWSKDRLLLAYRWQAYELEGSVFDLSDVISTNLIKSPSLIWRFINIITKSRFDHIRWFKNHKRPLKQSSLIARRILTNQPSEDIINEQQSRLSKNSEDKSIAFLVEKLSAMHFGQNWRDNLERSNLLKNLHYFLDSKGIKHVA